MIAIPKDDKNIIGVHYEVWQQIDSTQREWVCMVLQIYPYGDIMIEENCIMEISLNMSGDVKYNQFTNANIVDKCLWYFFRNDKNELKERIDSLCRVDQFKEPIYNYLASQLKDRP